MKEIYKKNLDLVLNEKHEDWAVLTNLKTGKSCGISPVGAFIWKQINGKRTKQDILAELGKVVVGNLPPEAGDDFEQFIVPLMSKGWLVKIKT